MKTDVETSPEIGVASCMVFTTLIYNCVSPQVVGEKKEEDLEVKEITEAIVKEDGMKAMEVEVENQEETDTKK